MAVRSQTKENPVSIWKNLQHEKTVPFAFYFVNQNEFQTSMWFVLTELVVKCGTNAEQLQLKSLKKFDFCVLCEN